MQERIRKFTARIGTTLDRFIDLKEAEFPYASGELSKLLRDIGLAGKIINREINRAGLTELAGKSGLENVQGEQQQLLDMAAHIRFVRALTTGKQTCCIVSEEEDEPILTDNPQAKYVVTMDPLDGSSNIDVNVPVGTIFSIFHRKTEPGSIPTEEDILQPGREQIAAGYILYGTSTLLVYTTGYGVNGFTYDPSLGEYYLSHPDLKFPAEGNTYSINESHFFEFPEYIQNYLTHCKKQGYTARYIGSLVADFHRNLLTGGIYLYPARPARPEGKLRLLYENNPLAFLAEQAGGLATDGQGRILDIVPTGRHQRTPLFIGSKGMVEEAMGYVSQKS